MKKHFIPYLLILLAAAYGNKAKANVTTGQVVSFTIQNNDGDTVAGEEHSNNTPIATNYTHSTAAAQLISFKSAVRNQSAEVIWVTQSEMNIGYFELERSTDGIKFTSFAKIPAVGKAGSINNYRGIDDLPQDTFYYRLKLIDRAGNVFYTKTERVNSKL